MTETEINLEILHRLGVNTSRLRNGKGLVSCIFHTDKSPSFSVDVNNGVCHCFSCQYSSTLKGLYYKQTGHGIMKDLGIEPSPTSVFTRKAVTPISFEDVPEAHVSFEGRSVPVEASPEALEYLNKRGISIDVAHNMKIEYVLNGVTKDSSEPSNKERWEYISNRIITPVYEKGKLLSLEMRDIKGEKAFKEMLKSKGLDESAKYKKVLYPMSSSTNTLFQLDRLDTSKPLYFLEGLMDLGVLRSDPFFKNSTSVFGASIGQRQQFLLKKFPELIYIADHDKAGLISIQRLKEQLGIPFKYVFAPKGCKDVGDIPQVLHTDVKSCRDRQWLTTIKSSENFDIIYEAKNSEFVNEADFKIIQDLYGKE